MNPHEFDRRYPAMFQPGGERIAGELRIDEQLAVPVAESAALAAPEMAASAVPEMAAMPEREEEAEEEAIDHSAAAAPGGVPALGPWLMWGVPAALGLAMLLLGSLVLFLPHWMAPTADPDPYAHGSDSTGQFMFLVYTLAPAASPMVAGGLGVLAIVFFLATQARPFWEAWLRRLFALSGSVLVGLGLAFQFSHYLVPRVTTKVVDAVSGQTVSYSTFPEITMVLLQLAPAPMLVGVLMLTALFLGRRSAAGRCWLAGLGLLAAAAAALSAPRLFPDTAPSIRDDMLIQPWPDLLPELAPTLVTAAVFTLMAGAFKDILPTRSARACSGPIRPAAQAGPEKEPWDDVEH